MIITRLSKTVLVAAIAFFATLVSFGNITDYGTNWPFVQHVLAMDTIFPTATIKYRAIDNPTMQTAAYILIIAAETLTAILCWIGAFHMTGHLGSPARAFNRSKAGPLPGSRSASSSGRSASSRSAGNGSACGCRSSGMASRTRSASSSPSSRS
jgi:hypothetical protein